MYIQNNHISIKILLLLVMGLFLAPLLNAQEGFTIDESFKGCTVNNPNVKLGGDAVFTSGNVDPMDDGWLRLTPDQPTKRGYAYVDEAFSAPYGLYMEFEYKTWRSVADESWANGADGFSIFLFNADNPNAFRIGDSGGSLGYGGLPGLAGGYLGIGIDEYGGFATPGTGRSGGVSGEKPNSIVIRGPESTGYLYLTHTQLSTIKNEQNATQSVDYNTITPTRPTDSQFYRKVKIYIELLETGKYRVRVLWRTSPNADDFTLINDYEIDYPIPTNLKVGFAASTGAGWNNHDVRNLYVTLIGKGERVLKSVDKPKANSGETLTYTIDVFNDESTPVSNMILNDVLEDEDGIPISVPNDFQITSITFNNNGKTGNTATGFTSGTPKTSGFTNPFSTTMTVDGSSMASFTIVGNVKPSLEGKTLRNTVELDIEGTGVIDPIYSNNFCSASTVIRSASTTSDISVTKSVNPTSANPGDELTYTINVSQAGSVPVSNLILKDTFKDNNGNVLSQDDFKITSITFNNNGVAGNSASGFASGIAKTSDFTNPLFTTMTLAANGTCSFTIVGTVKPILAGKRVVNTVELNITGTNITDPNLNNNSATTTTTISTTSGQDLMIEKSVNNDGIVSSTGNTFTILVTNVGSSRTNNNTTVTVTDVIPAGLSIVGTPSGSGWTLSRSGNNLSFTRSSPRVNAGSSYPPITIKVEATGAGPWTNTANVSYSSDPNSSNNTSSAFLKRRNYWHGTTDTDWANVANWTGNVVPAPGVNVEFATATNNGTTGEGNGLGVAINDLHLDQDRIIGDLINKSEKNLVVTTENQLTINGLVRSDNTGGIVVSAAHNKAMGTLRLATPTSNFNVVATVQFYNKAFVSQNSSFYLKEWQYFGVPIVQSNAFPYADVAGAETVNKWDEAYNGDKWRKVETADALNAFKGYQITNNTTTLPTGVYNFSGKINLVNAVVALTKTSNVNYSGTNLVANSFTAAIPIGVGAITFPIGAENTLYLFNTGTRDDWLKFDGSNQPGYYSGQYLAVPVNLGGQSNLPDRIPSTQAFMVRTTSNGNLKIAYSKLVKNTTVNRGDGTQIVTRSVSGAGDSSTSESTHEPQQPQLPSLVVDVMGQETADRVWIFQEPTTTHDFDNGWDGRKMLETGIVQLYVNTATDDSKLQVATVPELNGVSLGFVPEKDGEYTFDFSASGILKGADIYLHDAVTGTSEKVGDEQSYTFSAKKGDAVNRFVLTTAGNNRFLSVDESLLEVVVTNKGEIMLVNGSSKAFMAFVYNSKGDFLQQVEVKANSKQVMKDFAKGAYMVRLQNSEVNDVRRVTVE